MKRLIVGAIYRSKIKHVVWEAIGENTLRCLDPGNLGVEKGRVLEVFQTDPIFIAPSTWIITLPFNNYYYATKRDYS